MQTTFGLLSLSSPSSCTFSGITVCALHSAVPVSDASVTLIEQLVVGDFVLLHVPFDEVEVPCKEGVDFDETGAIDLEGLEVGSVGTLGRSPAGNDGFHTKLFVSTTSGLNLFIVQFVLSFLDTVCARMKDGP